jgi:hypothetical protein
MSLSFIILAVLVWIVASSAMLAFAFRAELVRAWREPVLRAPVLIFESDDWGYGPLEQAERLDEIASVLSRHRDSAGHPAVMTLGVVLCGPDTGRMAAENCAAYRRIGLSSPALARVRAAMASGARDGVFALQLHGMEHFWPGVLLSRTAHDSSVREWLTGGSFPETERLPPALQSRWIDASSLPSQALPADAIEIAAEEEVTAFHAMCGQPAEVVVPPTFVWTPAVETAWRRAGVRVLITPGVRYGRRDAEGKPVKDGTVFHNGQQSTPGLTCLVRDAYFEPALGHRAERALAEVEAKRRLGRPALMETHRSNFVGESAKTARSLAELDRLLGTARQRWPGMRFVSCAELARQYRERGELVERRLVPRLHCLVLRLARISRLRRLAWLTGVAMPLGIACIAGYRMLF